MRHFLTVFATSSGVGVAPWRLARAVVSPLPYPLPSPGLLTALFDRLAADSEYGHDLVLYAGSILRYGLRPIEAGAVLARDIGPDGCYVDARRTKTRHHRWAPAGFCLKRAEDAIDARAVAALHDPAATAMNQEPLATGTPRDVPGLAEPERHVGGVEPPLILAARDPERMIELRRRLVRIMASIGMTPYMLRHTYVTVRIAAVVAYRDDPEPDWPHWVRLAAQDLDPLRAAALSRFPHRQRRPHGLPHDHGSVRLYHTRQVYDQSTLWRVARLAEAQDMAAVRTLGGKALRARVVATRLRISPATLRSMVAAHDPPLFANALGLADVLQIAASSLPLLLPCERRQSSRT